jgi:subtilase family serine protease
VAVVDAYDYPNAATDLATYRSTFGLPACPSGSCFIKYNERGSTSSFPRFNLGWAQEMALDLQMVSAMCPNCKIILVEANSDGNSDLAAAVNTAASLGAHAIGNSYGGPEAGTQSSESAYNHAGVAVTASTGDTGYGAGPQFPATSPHVIAVGGTSLYQSNGARGWSETAWIDGGSGCSTIYGKPTWQNSVDNFCPNRTEADVAAVGDPSTGVAVYAPYTSSKSEWLIFGGTSASAQIISGIYGVNGGAVSYGSNPYSNASALNDITSGTNGRCSGSLICTAAPGYDGPTGMGTPKNATGF